jgi:hypothetical protein
VPQGPPPIRASDGERDAIVQRLSLAVSEGRLTLEEHIARVDAALVATTRAELEPVVADLPVTVPSAVEPAPVPEKQTARRRWIVSVMGEHHRQGRWRLSGRTSVVTLMAETNLDLRGAFIEEPEVHITAWLLMGEQRIIVPVGVEVDVTGFVIMGSRRVQVDDAAPRPGAPRVHIRAIGMMGEVRIESR